MFKDVAQESKVVVNLGTKKYWYEYSQQKLIPICHNYTYPDWWLLDEKEKTTFVLLKLERQEETQWDISYYKTCCAWTHPEIVIPGNLKVERKKVKILFENDHDCIDTGDGRREKCIECKIRENGGRCRGKVKDKDWRDFTFSDNSTADLSIQMLAHGWPIAERELLKKCQDSDKMFAASQFEKIEAYWMKECSDFEILEWKVGHVGEGEVHNFEFLVKTKIYVMKS